MPWNHSLSTHPEHFRDWSSQLPWRSRESGHLRLMITAALHAHDVTTLNSFTTVGSNLHQLVIPPPPTTFPGLCLGRNQQEMVSHFSHGDGSLSPGTFSRSRTWGNEAKRRLRYGTSLLTSVISATSGTVCPSTSLLPQQLFGWK